MVDYVALFVFLPFWDIQKFVNWMVSITLKMVAYAAILFQMLSSMVNFGYGYLDFFFVYDYADNDITHFPASDIWPKAKCL